MNLYKLLSDELKDKNWSIDEKIRYCYIRIGQLFSYDRRMCFEDVIDCDNPELVELDNVKTTDLTCHTFAYLFYNVITELFKLDCTIMGKGHNWVAFDSFGMLTYADATLRSDLSRIKLGLTTNGYRPAIKQYSFFDILKNIDANIKYINTDYNNNDIKNKANNVSNDYLKDNCLSSISDDRDFFAYKIYLVKELFEHYCKTNNFNDCCFAVSYFINKVFGNYDCVSINECFDIKNGVWSYSNIYVFSHQNNNFYFVLKHIDNNIVFYEISEREALESIKEFKNKKRILLK